MQHYGVVVNSAACFAVSVGNLQRHTHIKQRQDRRKELDKVCVWSSFMAVSADLFVWLAVASFTKIGAGRRAGQIKHKASWLSYLI